MCLLLKFSLNLGALFVSFFGSRVYLIPYTRRNLSESSTYRVTAPVQRRCINLLSFQVGIHFIVEFFTFFGQVECYLRRPLAFLPSCSFVVNINLFNNLTYSGFVFKYIPAVVGCIYIGADPPEYAACRVCSQQPAAGPAATCCIDRLLCWRCTLLTVRSCSSAAELLRAAGLSRVSVRVR